MSSTLPNVWNEGFTDYCEAQLAQKAAAYFRKHQLSEKREDWHSGKLRDRIWQSLGVEIDHSLPLNFEVHREVICDGYRIQNITYQSRKDFYVTGNLYIPDSKGPFPAVINMHGHWSQGRLAARVQQRAHILAKSSYVCLCVDAFGSGERCTTHGEFEYHGDNLGGSLLQFGESLMGIQLVDNMRGVDLLCSLPFVDSYRIGATGASGGGNQTMWLASMDERIAAAVPVVSVGSFQSYVNCLNCICELLVDGLTYTEEGGVLALTAPRALLVCNALQDSNPAFFPSEMLRSLGEARKIYKALNVSDKLDYYISKDGHGYWPEFQEAMLGWFNLYLKGTGSGKRTELPSYTTLPEEELFVFPKGQRDEKVCSIAEYFARLAEEWANKRKPNKAFLKEILRMENDLPLEYIEHSSSKEWRRITVSTKDERLLPVLLRSPQAGQKTVIISAPYGKAQLENTELFAELLNSDYGLAIIDPWACGENDLQNLEVNPNRKYARSLLWLGMTQQGKWVEDYQLAEKLLKELHPGSKICAAGIRDTAVAALLFAALHKRKIDLFLEEAPESLAYSPAKKEKFTMSILLPEILKCADIADLKEMAGGKIKSINEIN